MHSMKEYFSVRRKEVLVAAAKLRLDRGCRCEQLRALRSTYMNHCSDLYGQHGIAGSEHEEFAQLLRC